MNFVQPITFTEAVEKLGRRTPVAAKLNSQEWAGVPVQLRDRAYFSATVESIRWLSHSQDLLESALTGKRESVGNDQEALIVGNRADFIDRMAKLGEELGLGPFDPKDKGTLKDLTSERRLGLIFDVQTRSAQAYGGFKQGLDPDVLAEFPGRRFVRVRGVQSARSDHEGVEDVVRLATDFAFWSGLNKDFGVPYAPFGYGCGHDLEDVDRDECLDLGLIKRGWQPPAQPVPEYNETLAASVRGLRPERIEQLQDIFGDQVRIQDGQAQWRGNLIGEFFDRALSQPNWQSEIRLGKATPDAMAAADRIADLREAELRLGADDLRALVAPPGQRPATRRDLELLPHVWRQPDVVLAGAQPGSLEFRKELLGRSVMVITEPSAGAKLLRVRRLNLQDV